MAYVTHVDYDYLVMMDMNFVSVDPTALFEFFVYMQTHPEANGIFGMSVTDENRTCAYDEHTTDAEECEMRVVDGCLMPTLVVHTDDANSHTTTSWPVIVRFFNRERSIRGGMVRRHTFFFLLH